jgi:hypothetical protein
MIHLRIAAGTGSSTIKRSIEELMRECSLEPNNADPEKTRRRFEKAMNKLVADFMIAHWEYVTLPELPARNWLGVWMMLEVEVGVAPLMLEAGYDQLISQSRQSLLNGAERQDD